MYGNCTPEEMKAATIWAIIDIVFLLALIAVLVIVFLSIKYLSLIFKRIRYLSKLKKACRANEAALAVEHPLRSVFFRGSKADAHIEKYGITYALYITTTR